LESVASSVTGRTLWTAPGIVCVDAAFRCFAFPRHVHETFSIGFVVAGVNRFAHRGARHAATAGTLCVVNPDEAHTGEADAETGWRYVNLYLDEDAVRTALGVPERVAIRFRTSVVDHPAAAAAMRGLACAMSQAPAHDALEIECRLGALLDGLQPFADVSHAAPAPGRAAIARARELLAEATGRPASLADVARRLGVGVGPLARGFTRTFGISPYAYHLSRRIALAQRRLADGMDIAAVAVEAGFADQAHFTRHFRRLIGLTPGAIRPKTARL
jgi:AraC-like DNA-binding protein